jgi:pyruvate formate lyase activating enzyme
MGLWLEVVTLVVPGFNDSEQELTQMAEFLAGISTDIPWHVTAFHENYKMLDSGNTPASTLMRAAAIGRRAGLRYVYAGNLPGLTGNLEDTVCHACGERLVSRYGYQIRGYRVTAEGRCPSCSTPVAGRWSKNLS